MRVPAGVQNGSVVRVPGAGMTKAGGEGHGDAFILVNVRTTAAERQQLVREYVRLVSKSGVGCSANVCGNRRLQLAVLSEARKMGVQEAAEFERQFREAAAKPSPMVSQSTPKPAGAAARDPYRGMKVSLVKIRDLADSTRRLITENPWMLAGVVAGLFGTGGLAAVYLRRRRQEWAALELAGG